MNNFIYFEQFRRAKAKAESEWPDKFEGKRLLRNILVVLVLAVWLVIYFVLFSTKGIYVNDNFYRKSPNITQINYYAANRSTLPQEIVLKKNIGHSFTFIIDGQTLDVVVDTDANGNAIAVAEDYTADNFQGVHLSDLAMIAAQKSETIRGRWTSLALVVLLVIASLAAKLNAGRLYTLKSKTKVPSERYYMFFDIGLCLITVAGILYLTLTL